MDFDCDASANSTHASLCSNLRVLLGLLNHEEGEDQSLALIDMNTKSMLLVD
jgi:hypothetical protein